MKILYTILLLSLSSGFLLSQDQISIAEARMTDGNGAILRLGDNVILEGKAIGINFRPGGQTFALYSLNDGIGIGVFSLDDPIGYTFNEYENLRITGTLDQFNGLAQIVPTSIEVVAGGGINPSTRIATTLSEETESAQVVYRDATLVDPSQWLTAGFTSGFNVDVTNGTTTIQLRIDADTDIAGMEAPSGTFSVTGIGGQFDADSPFDSGYQLFPRSIADIDPYVPGGGGGDDYKFTTINNLRENDADGVPMMDGEKVFVTSVVYGSNLRETGVQFTLINSGNIGIGVFNDEDDFGYTVQEGDLVTVKGTVQHFNGLTQLFADDIEWASSGNDLVAPRTVTSLSEETESSLVSFSPQGVVDESAWLGDGSSFNVEFLNDDGEVVLLRIDNDTDVSDLGYQGSIGTIYTGIGGQFDSDAAYDSGYQLTPRYTEDITFYLSNSNTYKGLLDIYPNPATEMINVSAEDQIEALELYDLAGRWIKVATGNSQVSLPDLDGGTYILKVILDKGVSYQKVVVR